jgi:alpha-glucoside transport system permease protein
VTTGSSRAVGTASSVTGRVVVALVAIVWTLPATGAILTALRPSEIGGGAGWWNVVTDPRITLDNLRDVLAGSGPAPGMWESFSASLAIALPATALLVTLAAPAAYALAWISFPGRTWLFLAAVALVFAPIQVALVPLVAVYDGTGLRGTWPGLWLAHVAFGLPLAVVLLRGAMASVPADLVDAARSDGASHLDTLWRVVVPLTIPALAAVTVLQFLVVWNDFLVAATLLGGPDPGTAPLPLALADLVRARPQDHHLLSAGALVTITVPLVVFAAMHRLVLAATGAAPIRD